MSIERTRFEGNGVVQADRSEVGTIGRTFTHPPGRAKSASAREPNQIRSPLDHAVSDFR
jgi:hypothetical protein